MLNGPAFALKFTPLLRCLEVQLPPSTLHMCLLEITQAGISLDYGQERHSSVCICSASAHKTYRCLVMAVRG